MSRAARELTTTSYALLGLLAVRAWSTYELAKQMKRNLHFFWPRAESNLYAEAKRLVAGGWARADARPVGQRRRTVYSITARGRRALEAWLNEPASPARLESEPLVKFAFSENATKATAIANLQRFREDAATRLRDLRAIFEQYLRGEIPFPQRIHINVVAWRLVWAHAESDLEWATWALEEVGRWPSTRTPTGREASLEILRRALDSQTSP